MINRGIMITAKGIIKVLRIQRNTTRRPGKSILANTYPDMEWKIRAAAVTVTEIKKELKKNRLKSS
jgi:hypothetical protein